MLWVPCNTGIGFLIGVWPISIPSTYIGTAFITFTAYVTASQVKALIITSLSFFIFRFFREKANADLAEYDFTLQFDDNKTLEENIKALDICLKGRLINYLHLGVGTGESIQCFGLKDCFFQCP